MPLAYSNAAAQIRDQLSFGLESSILPSFAVCLANEFLRPFSGFQSNHGFFTLI
jgi:hypothetical protein